MGPTLLEFSPEAAGDAEWRQYHALRRAVYEADNPDDPVPPDEFETARLLHPDPTYLVRRLLLVENGQAIAWARLSATRPGAAEYESNRATVRAGIRVHPARRRGGLARSLVPQVVAFAREQGARLITGDAEGAAGRAFAERFGGQARQRAWESRLWMDRVPWERMRDWAATAPAGYREERYEPFVPEELWPVYAPAYSELERHAPRDGLEASAWILTPERMAANQATMRASGGSLHVLALWDGLGLAALTEMFHADAEPYQLIQELTAVHPRARGRGLARYAKARLLLALRDRYPAVRHVRTWNSGTNAAMWGINAAMGYERYREEVAYQASLDTVEAAAAG